MGWRMCSYARKYRSNEIAKDGPYAEGKEKNTVYLSEDVFTWPVYNWYNDAVGRDKQRNPRMNSSSINGKHLLDKEKHSCPRIRLHLAFFSDKSAHLDNKVLLLKQRSPSTMALMAHI